MTGEPTQSTATQADAGRSCPYCRFPLKQGGDLTVCGHCHSAHHRDCWTDNGGCAVMGCAGGPITSGGGRPLNQPANPPSQAETARYPPQPAEQTTRVYQQSGQGQPSYVAAPQQAYDQQSPYSTSQPAPKSGNNTGWIVAGVLVVLVLLGGGVAGAMALSSGGKPQPNSVQTVTVSGSPSTAGQNATAPGTSTPASTAASTPATTSAPQSTSNTGGQAAAKQALNAWFSDQQQGNWSSALAAETPGEQSNNSHELNASADPQYYHLSISGVSVSGTSATAHVNFYTKDNSSSCTYFSGSMPLTYSGGHWLLADYSGQLSPQTGQPGSDCH